MSYTMTLDMPQKEAAYVERHSARFCRELNAIALVIVQAQMQYEGDTSADSDLDYVADWGRFKIQEGELGLSRANEPLQGECTDRSTGLQFLKRLRGTGPFLNDEEMHVFDRAKDYGRAIDLA